jgi:hypothetical protein
MLHLDAILGRAALTREPKISWRREQGASEVLVAKFDHGVELRLANETSLRMAHWETKAEFDPEVQRAEVSRALEWGRVHDRELRARLHARHTAALVKADARRLAKGMLSSMFAMPLR